MNGLLRLAGGLLLAASGAFMLTLAGSDVYWFFLNPRFMFLTGATGALLLVMGIFAPFEKVSACGCGSGSAWARLPRLAAFAVFLVLASIALEAAVQGRPVGMATPSLPSSFSGPPAPSRLTHDGHEYVGINTGELYLLARSAREPDAEPLAGRRFVVRGEPIPWVAGGGFTLTRVMVVCCFADAVAAGVRVPGELPDLEPGEWVAVYGRMEPAPEPTPGQRPELTGVVATLVVEDAVLVPEYIEVQDPPELPYLFEFHESEPYAY